MRRRILLQIWHYRALPIITINQSIITNKWLYNNVEYQLEFCIQICSGTLSSVITKIPQFQIKCLHDH